MTNPKIICKQNQKGEWHFAVIARNGKSVLIGGETFKRRPTLNKLFQLKDAMQYCLFYDRVQYIQRKKK